jgi:hypothetical protein
MILMTPEIVKQQGILLISINYQQRTNVERDSEVTALASPVQFSLLVKRNVQVKVSQSAAASGPL